MGILDDSPIFPPSHRFFHLLMQAQFTGSLEISFIGLLVLHLENDRQLPQGHMAKRGSS
jgi:hypothetical protein